ncbi:hypothetical protein D3C81_2320780 [compost metagenome]
MGVDEATQQHLARQGLDMDMQAQARFGHRQRRFHPGGNPRVVRDHFQVMRVMLKGMTFHGATLRHTNIPSL